MRENTSRSPSPIPDAPIAATPGLRASALQKIFAQALTSTLKTNNYENFSACFPTPAAHCPAALEGVWRQLNAKLEENCTREFESICRERDVVKLLNEWDGRVEDARRRKARSRGDDESGESGPTKGMHTLTGDELYQAHLAPSLVKSQQVLETSLKGTQEVNVQLMGEIEAQRREIESMVAGVENIVKDLQGSVESMAQGIDGGIDDLKSETWKMHEEQMAT